MTEQQFLSLLRVTLRDVVREEVTKALREVTPEGIPGACSSASNEPNCELDDAPIEGVIPGVGSYKNFTEMKALLREERRRKAEK